MSYNYTPRTQTQKDTFKKLLNILQRDNASIEGSYDSINGTTTLQLICKCGTSFKKYYKQLKNTGAFCKICMYTSASEKRKVTSNSIHGVDNISKLSSIKDKKKTTALSNGFIKTIADWLKDIEATGLHNYWEYLFDTINGYDSPHSMRHKKCGTIVEKSPRSHLQQDDINTSGQGCLHCYHNAKRMTREEFQRLSIEKYGPDKFLNYQSVPCIIPNNKTAFSLHCSTHGQFITNYDTHLHGAGGCIPCSNNQKTVKEIIELYGETLGNRGIELILDNYSNDEILVLHKSYPARCLTNMSHPIWNPVLSNVIKLGTGCPHCNNGRQYSKAEIEWMMYIAVSKPTLRHALHKDGQYRIGDRKLKVDGAIEDEKVVFEFHGCYFHGCNKCFHDRDTFNMRVKKTYNDLYNATVEKREFIESCKFKYIEMWECEWTLGKKSVIKLQQLWRQKHNNSYGEVI